MYTYKTYFLEFIFSIREIATSSFRFIPNYELYINILSLSFSYSDVSCTDINLFFNIHLMYQVKSKISKIQNVS